MQSATVSLLIGALCLVGGVLAILYPFASSLAVETFLGYLFLISGIAGIFGAFQQSEDRPIRALLGLVMLTIGVFLIANPPEGLAALTSAFAVALVTSGVLRVIWAALSKQSPVYWPTLLSGAASILLGAMIFANFPKAAHTGLGILLGVELILVSVPLILVSVRIR